MAQEQSTKRIASLLVVAAIAIVAAFAGCGGDSGDSSAATAEQSFKVQASTTMTTGSLPKAQFIAHLNKLCRQGWFVIRDNFAQQTSWQDQKASKRDRFAEAIRVSLLAGIDFHLFDNVRLLGAPQGEEADIEDIIGPMQEAVERGQRLKPIYTPAELWALFEVYNQRAARYGLDDCLVNQAHAKI